MEISFTLRVGATTHDDNPVVHDPSAFSISKITSMYTIVDHSDTTATRLPGLRITLDKASRPHARFNARARTPTECRRRSAYHPQARTTLEMNMSGFGYLGSLREISLQ